MNIPDYAVAFSIAALYPLFFRKVVDVATNKNDVEQLCHNPKDMFFNRIYDTTPSPDDDECIREKKLRMKKHNVIRFGTLLCAGIFAIILSYVLKQPALVLGLGFAGVLTILDATYGYWHNMDDKVKMTMVGLALVALMSSPALFKKYVGTLRHTQ